MFFFKKKSQIDKTVKIGRFSRIIYSDIGRYTYVGPNSVIRNSKIGSFCSISENVKIGYGKHPLNYVSTSPVFYSKKNPLKRYFFQNKSFNEFEKVIIGNDVLIGANVFIMDGIKIGDGAVIGAGSIVTKDIKDFQIVGGVPATLIRYRFGKKIIKEIMNDKWWNWPDDKILENETYFTTKLENE